MTKSPDETRDLALKIAARLKGGEVIGLIGELGAGKTCFIQGLARGLNVSRDVYVSSPTFTLLKIYNGDLDIYHFDFYRLHDPADFEDLGFDDYLNEDGVVVIEWADRFKELLPKDMIVIEFKVVGDMERRVDIINEAGNMRQEA